MVLELLEGGSLRSMLDQGTLLTVSQAARVGRDVASALEYAHARDVLHRDIKPANLLFDEHGIVRVADFGLARALAEASWTEPAGGDVRHRALRVARAGDAACSSTRAPTSIRSRSCSSRAVTGRVPFAADTTLGMLTARTQQPLIAPDELGPLAAVIDRVGATRPERPLSRRGHDAPGARRRRRRAAAARPAAARGHGRSRRSASDAGRGARVAAVVRPGCDGAVARQPAPRTRTRRNATGSAGATASGRPGNGATCRGSSRRRSSSTVAVCRDSRSPARRAARARSRCRASSAGRQAAAETLARSKGLTASVTTEAAPDPVGTVIDQSPDVGAWTSGTNVHLTVSTGPAKVAMPPIQGEPWSKAQKQLDAIGFSYGTPAQEYSDTVPTGNVKSVTPAGGVSNTSSSRRARPWPIAQDRGRGLPPSRSCPADRRVLRGLCLRPESTSRVPAADAGVQRSL